ncbi:MAG: DUF6524 family protein [Pseudomonadota bacterium]
MGPLGFFLRLGFAIVLVLATYNPVGPSLYHWFRDGFETDLPLKALASVVMLIGYVICVRATFRSIGVIGVLLVAALIGAIMWVLFDYQILTPEDPGLMQWVVLLGVGLVLGIGLSWSHVRRQLSGQMDTDDVDE